MIETLYGRIFETDALACTAIIECAGVGYKVSVTANTLAQLPAPEYEPDGTQISGKPVRIYTHMAVREDGVELYGFYSREELAMFRLLISVSGVGPKAGMSILSLLTPKKLALVIASEDTKAISRAPGVGAKTAARVVLELKEKVAKNFPQFTADNTAEPDAPAAAAKPAKSGSLADARDALVVLGYSRSEVTAAMKNVDTTKSTETIIKQALAVLMKN